MKRVPPEDSSILVVDAMKGFTTKGTFGKAFGESDVKPIDEAFRRLQGFLNDRAAAMGPKCVINSEYEYGQFVSNPNHPLYDLCTRHTEDLEDAIQFKGDWLHLTKRDNDATKAHGFSQWIHEMRGARIKRVILAGCTLTTCIKETALSLRDCLNKIDEPKIEVLVPLSLVGCRMDHILSPKYQEVVKEMREKGIKVLKTLDY